MHRVGQWGEGDPAQSAGHHMAVVPKPESPHVAVQADAHSRFWPPQTLHRLYTCAYIGCKTCSIIPH